MVLTPQCASGLPEGLGKTQVSRPQLEILRVGVGRGPGTCISDELPGDAAGAYPGTSPELGGR